MISINIAQIADEMKKEGDVAMNKILNRRFRLRVTYDQFTQLFAQSANYILRINGFSHNFTVDNRNESTLKQLHLYLAQSDQFAGDLRKGIMLQGRYGCGKSLLMESYAHLQNYLIKRYEVYTFPLLTFTTSNFLCTEIAKNGVQPYAKRVFVIDEFGREPKSVMDFGNTYHPMAELISVRADKPTITHGTTNFTLETLTSDGFYGSMIGDRLRAMFNFIVLDGGSRRM